MKVVKRRRLSVGLWRALFSERSFFISYSWNSARSYMRRRPTKCIHSYLILLFANSIKKLLISAIFPSIMAIRKFFFIHVLIYLINLPKLSNLLNLLKNWRTFVLNELIFFWGEASFVYIFNQDIDDKFFTTTRRIYENIVSNSSPALSQFWI